MSSRQSKLSLTDGVTLAIGSVMGSGVLFLPGFTYQIAGSDAVISWLVATLLCFPLLLIFRSIVRQAPNSRGLEGWVAFSLGERWAPAVPYLLLGTVCLGMPASALIAGEYVSLLFDGHSHLQLLVAISLILLPAVLGSFGIQVSCRVQRIMALTLLLLGVALFFASFDAASEGLSKIKPTFAISPTLAGVATAFWAYAGFENMTFMADEFENPKLDIPLAIGIALVVCGLAYTALTINYMAVVDWRTEYPASLFTLASVSKYPVVTKIIVSGFALVAVFFNFLSWMSGIARMIQSSTNRGHLPPLFSHLRRRNTLGEILFSFAGICIVIAVIEWMFPAAFSMILSAVSTNFVALYLICAFGYLRKSRSLKAGILGMIICSALGAALVSSGIIATYSLVLAIGLPLSLQAYKSFNKKITGRYQHAA